MLIGSTATLIILVVIGIFGLFFGGAVVVRTAKYIAKIPGRIVGWCAQTAGNVVDWFAKRREARARALEAEQRAQNEQIRDLFKR
jgi:hypothetical protein